MKKRIIAFMMAAAVAATLSACSTTVNVNTPGEGEMQTGIATPWRDCTEEEAYQYGPNGFSAPEGATNIHWSLCEAKDDTTLPGTMVQLRFDYDGLNFTAREQPVAGTEITDISGMYYDWTVTEEGRLKNWAGGNMRAKFMRYVGEDEMADVCLWFDIETGYAYSLSTAAPDLDGFDIQAVAEAIYDPAKQIGANAPDENGEKFDETSDDFIAQAAENAAPSIDITGCDTFTNIVDEKLTAGMGYANEKIANEDVLLVCSGAYDNLDGNMAAIDVTVFIYKDGVPYEAGKACSGGTAYPIAVADGILYTASNHWVCKYTIENDRLVISEKATVEYDTEGNPTYDGDLEGLYGQMQSAAIVNFSVISKLPAYEYTGDDPVYGALYRYIVDGYASGYPAAQVSIPYGVIVAEERDDSGDIKIWGNFWILNYNLKGDTLECASGGSYPGLVHLKETADGYEVTGMDVVADGSEYDKSAKKIFGKYYEDFVKSGADTDKNAKIRTDMIRDYVDANDLPIAAYKDFGWDPVTLR